MGGQTAPKKFAGAQTACRDVCGRGPWVSNVAFGSLYIEKAFWAKLRPLPGIAAVQECGQRSREGFDAGRRHCPLLRRVYGWANGPSGVRRHANGLQGRLRAGPVGV